MRLAVALGRRQVVVVMRAVLLGGWGIGRSGRSSRRRAASGRGRARRGSAARARRRRRAPRTGSARPPAVRACRRRGHGARASSAFGQAAGSPPPSSTASRTRRRRCSAVSWLGAARRYWSRRVRAAPRARARLTARGVRRDRASGPRRASPWRAPAAARRRRRALAARRWLASAHSAAGPLGGPARRPLRRRRPHRARSRDARRLRSPADAWPGGAVPRCNRPWPPVAVRHPRLSATARTDRDDRRARPAPRQREPVTCERSSRARCSSSASRTITRCATAASKSATASGPISSVPPFWAA